ncbi:acyltransferase [Micromonospora sp. NPDC049679]|uniref:acyltransferase family protein n=1 Tax=Micromonospora sp. NPDC049679 TaxID=3155920 RepID=UPI0033D481CF
MVEKSAVSSARPVMTRNTDGPVDRTASGRPTSARIAGRIEVVDGLRFLAALMVVTFHLIALPKAWNAPPEELFPVLRLPAAYGWLGVELFFLVSGFVICMSSWGRSLGDFFVSRVARLYPAYLFGILATTGVLVLVADGLERLSIKDILMNLTMLQEPLGARHVDGVYWTLWVELRFYLLFSVVVWRGLTYRRAVAFCFVWAAAAVLMSQADNGPLKHLVMPDYCWYFIAGIGFYLMYRFRPTLLLTLMVVGSFLAAHQSTLRRQGTAEKYLGTQIPEWPTTMLVAAFFIVMALIATGRLSWIRGKWLVVAGALTYPLYLLHENIGWEVIGVFEGDIPALLLVSVLVAALLLASWLVHRLIERPGTRWLRTHLRAAVLEARTGLAEVDNRSRREDQAPSSTAGPTTVAGDVTVAERPAATGVS